MSKYKEAGVDIAKGDALSKEFGEMALATMNVPGTELHTIGGFGGAIRLPTGYHHPVLVSGTDGVGTKVLLANNAQIAHNIGLDLVAMCVNDILTVGAKPLTFLDYMAAHSLDMSDAILRDIMGGIVDGCRQAGAALVGGETAELKLMYQPGEFDLAGFATGIVDEDEMIDPKVMIEPGMTMVGIASSGVHSNGFSLIHKIIKDQGIDLDQQWNNDHHNWKEWSRLCTVREVLCQPTAVYVRPVMNAIHEHGFDIRGMAHITGGGLFGNIARILPEDCQALLNWSWQDYPLWDWLKVNGRITSHEMVETFNMGIGYVIVVPNSEADNLIGAIEEDSFKAWNIGKITEVHPDYANPVRLEPT